VAHPGEVHDSERGQRAHAEELFLREQSGGPGADRRDQDHHQAEHEPADFVLPQEREAQQPHGE